MSDSNLLRIQKNATVLILYSRATIHKKKGVIPLEIKEIVVPVFRIWTQSTTRSLGPSVQTPKIQHPKDPSKPNKNHIPLSMVGTDDHAKEHRDSIENQANTANLSDSDDGDETPPNLKNRDHLLDFQ